ncbi:hypothetical protein H4R99_000199 [Coemansia sp. RSA 1722]|nr:hypothetical protein GGF39_001277 [Coemansia sp. RSA 1721]KAJ2606773.1 hypothetical protein H4R99_000199 [Coemansia sp. RSA 1722]KAJ2638857.1 hypothetical protein GGF40_001333 [Coemansia sp. RSA 1286]
MSVPGPRKRTATAPVQSSPQQQEPMEVPPGASRSSSIASAPSTLAESLRSYWESRRGPTQTRRGTGHNLFRNIYRPFNGPGASYRDASYYRSMANSKRMFVLTSAKVNNSVSRLVSLILRDFVDEWYQKITDDKEFISEVSTQIMMVVNEIEKRCRRVDWVQFLLFEAPDILHLHVRDARQCMARLDTVYAGRENSIEAMFQSMQPHVALAQAADSELAYLRLLSRELLTVFMPPDAQTDEVVLHLVREILACAVLRNVVDVIADPSTLNEAIIKAAGKHSKKEYFRNADMSRYVTQPMSIDDSEKPSENNADSVGNSNDVHSQDSEAPGTSVEAMLRDAQTTRISNSGNKNDVAAKTSHRKSRSPEKSRLELIPEEDHSAHSMTARSSSLGGRPSEIDSSVQGSLSERLGSQLSFASRWLLSDLFSQKRWRGWKNNTIRGLVYLHLIITQAFSRIFSVFSEYTFSLNQLWQPDSAQPSYRGAIESILGLANAILLLDQYNQWVWVQFIFYIFPLINILAGVAIDRTLVKVVWFLIGEQQIASYVDLLIENLWKPENGGKFKSGNKPYKTLEQEEMLRRDAAELVAEVLPYVATRFFYGQSDQDRLVAAQRILEPFENRQLNKHLIYNILDAIVGKIAPELRESVPLPNDMSRQE